MPTSNSDPAEIQKTDRKRQVLVMLRQGAEIRDIADELRLNEEYVRQLARAEMEYLSLQVQELQEHFVAMTWARSEKIMSRLFPVFDVEPPSAADLLDMTPKERADMLRSYQNMIGDALNNFVKLARLQKDILQVKGVGESKKPGDITIEKMAVQNVTFNADSDFYKEALASMQTDLLGETFPEMQARLAAEADVIQLPDDRLEKIERAVEKLHVSSQSSAEAAEE